MGGGGYRWPAGWPAGVSVGCRMLRLATDAHRQMLAHAIRGYPLEACGLLGGRVAGGAAGRDDVVRVEQFVPCRNADASAKTYAVGPDGFLAADRQLAPAGLDVVGVVHSHTHTDAYPSPTDIAKGDNPMLAGWRFAIVSLRHESPSLRCYLLDGGVVAEEPVELF